MLKICKYVYYSVVKYDLLLYDLVCNTISYTITIYHLVFYTRYNHSLYPIAPACPCLASPGLPPARLVQARASGASRYTTQRSAAQYICAHIMAYMALKWSTMPYTPLYGLAWQVIQGNAKKRLQAILAKNKAYKGVYVHLYIAYALQ